MDKAHQSKLGKKLDSTIDLMGKNMRTLQQWLDEYGVSHQNKTNKMVHWICVPAIVFSLIGLLVSIPFPFVEKSFFANWAAVVIALALLFYLRLSFNMFLSMGIVMIGMLGLNLELLKTGINLPVLSVFVFAVAWVGQFWGHKIEGKKPSFLKDIQFLLIGPAWLMHFIYKKWGWKY
jgi:uncharacterized membrane protein YGL010W